MTIRDLVPEPVPDEMMEVLDFAPGAVMGGTPHLPGTREFFTCLDGRVNLTVAGDRYALDSGDVLAFPGQPAALLSKRRSAAAGPRRVGRRSGQGRCLSRAWAARTPATRLGYSLRLSRIQTVGARCRHRRSRDLTMTGLFGAAASGAGVGRARRLAGSRGGGATRFARAGRAANPQGGGGAPPAPEVGVW